MEGAVSLEEDQHREIYVTTGGRDWEVLQSRVFSFSFDVHHECCLLVPGWPPARDGAFDRQGSGVGSCKLQLQPSDVLEASRWP